MAQRKGMYYIGDGGGGCKGLCYHIRKEKPKRKYAYHLCFTYMLSVMLVYPVAALGAEM